jgi:aryl-alcohol dehydrogenase-like predicted oxidoreductase
MNTHLLGNSDLRITRFGFGAWAAGGGRWQFGWSAQDDNESNPAVTGAIIGARNATQVQDVFPHADLILTPEEIAEIAG